MSATAFLATTATIGAAFSIAGSVTSMIQSKYQGKMSMMKLNAQMSRSNAIRQAEIACTTELSEAQVAALETKQNAAGTVKDIKKLTVDKKISTEKYRAQLKIYVSQYMAAKNARKSYPKIKPIA